MNKSVLKKMATSLFAAIIIAALCHAGVLYGADNAVSDALYQRKGYPDERILVCGIDTKALEDLGPLPWPRDIMAMAIENLNADPAGRPAVIGIDVLYIGETDPYCDDYLAEAAAEYGNVVLAAAANTMRTVVVQEDGSFPMKDVISSFDEPFDAVRAVTGQGHINAMYDEDGVLRHGLLYIDLPDGRRFPSFHYQVYQKFAAVNGLDPNVLPPLVSAGWRHFWYVPFEGLPRDYYYVSVSDLIAGDFDSDLLAGNIVLIGPYAPGLQDDFTTAIDPTQKMYGVEYQANMIDALIRGDFKKEAPDPWQAVSLFFICLMCFFWFWDRRVFPATLMWLLVSAGWVGICLAAYHHGYVLHVLWVPLSVTVLYVATVAANYVRAALERRRVTNTFKKYVAPEIVNEILKEGSEALGLGGKLTDIAVLFVDIRGFTPMSEILEPPQVVELLNEYLTLTSSCIMKNGGTLDKFIGDATMAFWGAPLPQEDYIFRAVKTALDMVEGSKMLSEKLVERYGRTVSFGIGVHCGKAVVGNIGAQMRMDYTAIGDTVNTAARLEANAPAGKVLISRTVADALEGRVCVTSLGDSIKLKGKAAGFEILVVEGLTDAQEPPNAQIPPDEEVRRIAGKV